jgi:uncharacterized protein (TIGR02145 family)
MKAIYIKTQLCQLPFVQDVALLFSCPYHRAQPAYYQLLPTGHIMKTRTLYLTSASLFVFGLHSLLAQVTDIDGTRYKTVKIGDQTWMAENLKVTHFRNGSPIRQVKNEKEWQLAAKKKQPAWCYAENLEGNGLKYGILYNWYAVTDPRGITPEGWHVPSLADWTTLWNHVQTAYAGTNGSSGMKRGTELRKDSGWPLGHNGTNETGFAGMPGGLRPSKGAFNHIKDQGWWWSVSGEGKSAYAAHLTKLSSEVATADPVAHIFKPDNLMDKGFGLSVRCVKD